MGHHINHSTSFIFKIQVMLMLLATSAGSYPLFFYKNPGKAIHNSNIFPSCPNKPRLSSTMKPQHICGESSLREESKRGFRERLGQAYQATVLVMARHGAQNGVAVGRGLLISKAIERRTWSSSAEDPIRTLMFLGSWNHT